MRNYGADFISAINGENGAGPNSFVDGGEGTDTLRLVVSTQKAARLYIEGAAEYSSQQTDFGFYFSCDIYDASKRTYTYDYPISSASSDKPLAQIVGVEKLTIASKGQPLDVQANVLKYRLISMARAVSTVFILSAEFIQQTDAKVHYMA